jgi:ribosome-associated protein
LQYFYATYQENAFRMTSKSKTSSRTSTKLKSKPAAKAASKPASKPAAKKAAGAKTARNKRPVVSARSKSAAAAALTADPKLAKAKKAKAAAAKKANTPKSRGSGDKAAGKKADVDQVGLDGALRALHFALDKKALEPVLLDVRDLCSFCNYQLVLSGKTDRQVDAIADGISFGLKGEGVRALGAESTKGGQWALLDYGDFVVHVFVHSIREHYDLEGLWNDASRVAIDVPKEARIPISEQYA